VVRGGFLALLVLQAAAAGFGLADRETGAGRAGLVLSLLGLALLVGSCCCLFYGAIPFGGTGVHG
jgi:hypothetical protein